MPYAPLRQTDVPVASCSLTYLCYSRFPSFFPFFFLSFLGIFLSLAPDYLLYAFLTDFPIPAFLLSFLSFLFFLSTFSSSLALEHQTDMPLSSSSLTHFSNYCFLPSSFLFFLPIFFSPFQFFILSPTLPFPVPIPSTFPNLPFSFYIHPFHSSTYPFNIFTLPCLFPRHTRYTARNISPLP